MGNIMYESNKREKIQKTLTKWEVEYQGKLKKTSYDRDIELYKGCLLAIDTIRVWTKMVRIEKGYFTVRELRCMALTMYEHYMNPKYFLPTDYAFGKKEVFGRFLVEC